MDIVNVHAAKTAYIMNSSIANESYRSHED